MKASKITAYLAVYGLAHAIVDASCILLILGGIDLRSGLISYILLYNMLAFGLQLPFGWIIDKVHKPVFATVLGLIVISLALLLFSHPLLATVLAGIGNALFHVGGGTVSLNLIPGKASMPGVFVAPGGIGLFAGGIISKFYGYHPYIFVTILAITGILIISLKAPTVNYTVKSTKPFNYIILAILLLLLTICTRSAVGLSLEFPWKTNITLLIILTTFIALGKGIGGFLSDYFGWTKVTVSGLAISAFLIFFWKQVPAIGIAGMFLFNLTMPVTLVAISNLLPGRPGFSFGLTTFALIAGALPTFYGYKTLINGSWATLILIFLSAVALFIGLRFYSKCFPVDRPDNS